MRGAAVFAITVVPTAASAQEWLRDRRFSEGPGIRAGDLELHPGIGGEVGYDSNWFLRSDKSAPNIVNGPPQNPATDGGMFRITPHMTVSTLGPQRNTLAPGAPPAVTFRGGVSATYREFLGKQELRDQRNVSGHADMRLEILPQRPWGAAVYALYDRTIQATVLGNPDLSFNRDDLGLGGEIVAQPNSGTLEWRLGGQVHGALFESTNGAPFNNVTYEVNTRGRWKFRPRTALIYDGTARFLGYTNANRATTSLHDSTPVRARFGITGLVTPRLSVLAMAGYAASFYRPGSDPTVQQYDSVIGQAEIKFFPTANAQGGELVDASLTLSSIALGYVRDYQNSYLGDFYGSDRGYAKVAYFFAGRALASLEGGVGAVEYPTIYFNPAAGLGTAPVHAPFTDIRLDTTLFGEYRFTDSFAVNTTLNYAQNFSDTQLPVPTTPGAPAGQVFDLSWKRFQAFLGVRLFL